MRHLLIAIFSLFIFGCASRAPVPVGAVPEPPQVSEEDERYGHEVLSELTKQYKLDRDDTRVNRVRDLVDKITATTSAGQQPWHVYLLISPDFKNAAATRGNYIFVWSGLLDSVRDDNELATILSHEIAHVLAGHTTPTPTEEVNQIVAKAAGTISSQVWAMNGGVGILGDLISSAVSTGIEAMIVNPEQRRKELEADPIGLFLLADAGINPERAVQFWERVRTDPNFAGFPLEFLSTHPGSDSRFEKLKELLPAAMARNQNVVSSKKGVRSAGFAIDREFKLAPPVQTNNSVNTPPPPPRSTDPNRAPLEEWVVVEPDTKVHASPDAASRVLGTLKDGEKVSVDAIERRWLRIVSPISGYVLGRQLSPF